MSGVVTGGSPVAFSKFLMTGEPPIATKGSGAKKPT
jgi:hypothetical protein